MHFPQACLFDLDGVLLDTEKLHSKVWMKSASIIGIKLNEEQLMKLKGRRRIDCATQILKWGQTSVLVGDFLKLHKPIYSKLMANVQAMSGAEDVVNWCSEKKLPMALVTSSSCSSVNIKSGSHYWLKQITTRVYGDDPELDKGKPAPDPFLLAAHKLGIKAKSCWAIEDSESGSKSALKAGCQVWFLNTFVNRESESSHLVNNPNPYYIKQLSEFLEALKRSKKRNI